MAPPTAWPSPQALATLDRVLPPSPGKHQLTQTVDLDLHNRELDSEEDVEALLQEIESRLLPLVQLGGRARIL